MKKYFNDIIKKYSFNPLSYSGIKNYLFVSYEDEQTVLVYIKISLPFIIKENTDLSRFFKLEGMKKITSGSSFTDELRIFCSEYKLIPEETYIISDVSGSMVTNFRMTEETGNPDAWMTDNYMRFLPEGQDPENFITKWKFNFSENDLGNYKILIARKTEAADVFNTLKSFGSVEIISSFQLLYKEFQTTGITSPLPESTDSNSSGYYFTLLNGILKDYPCNFNLASGDIFQKQGEMPERKFVVRVSLALFSFILIMLFVLYSGNYFLTSISAVNTDQILEAKEKRVMLKNIEKQNRKLEENIKQFQKIKTETNNCGIILSDLSRVIPGRCKIKDIAVSRTTGFYKAELSGVAFSQSDVISFIDKLEHSYLFKNPELISSSQTLPDESGNFEVIFKIKTGYLYADK